MSQAKKSYQKINLVFAKRLQKINKRAGPNKNVQGGSLVKNKYVVHARLLGSLEYLYYLK